MMELLHQLYPPAPAADVKTVCISRVPQAGATLPPYGHLLQQGLCPVQAWHVSTVSIKTPFAEETTLGHWCLHCTYEHCTSVKAGHGKQALGQAPCSKGKVR